MKETKKESDSRKMRRCDLYEDENVVSRDEVLDDMDKANNKLRQYSMRIYMLPQYGDYEHCPGFGLNWAGIGTVEIEEAEKHLEGVTLAIGMLEKLNGMYEGCTMVE